MVYQFVLICVFLCVQFLRKMSNSSQPCPMLFVSLGLLTLLAVHRRDTFACVPKVDIVALTHYLSSRVVSLPRSCISHTPLLVALAIHVLSHRYVAILPTHIFQCALFIY